MKKMYPLLLLLAIIFHSVVTGQTVTIGAGASSGTASNTATGDAGPIYRSTNTSDFVYSRYHYLYTQSELAAAGITPGMNITTIGWNKDNVAATNSPATFQVWIKNSSKTTVGAANQVWTDLINGSTQVYNSNAVNIPSAAGWLDFAFNAPFLYSGGALEISTNFDISSGTSPWTTAGFSFKRDAITDRTLSYVGNTAPGTTLPNLRTVRPQVQFMLTPSGPCTTPPNAGTTIANPNTPVCTGSAVTFNLTGNSTGSGQSYQLQKATTQNGTYTNVGSPGNSSSVSANITTTMWYRYEVVCNGNTAYSQPVQVQVNPSLPAGNYTIGGPAGSGNFQTFAAAINALMCGISGPVTFDVAPGTYNEQVTIPQINGTSATNRVVFKGNGAILNYTTSDANNRTAVILNGADYVTIDSLTIDVSGGTYGWGVVLMNRADSNIIRNCTINTNTTATSTNYLGIAVNGSSTATSTSGNNGNGNLISGNTINGGYYGIQLYGSTTPYIQNNVVKDNVVKDFYSYGIYFYGTNNTAISGNELVRPNRTPVTTTYALYVSTNTNALVEKNRIHNLFDAAASSTSTVYCLYIGTSGVSTTEPNRVENNLIYNINNGAGSQYGIYGLGYNNYNYYHNTVVLDDAGSTAGATYGMYVYGTAVNVKNNIVIVSRGGTGSKYTMYYSTGVTTSNNNVLQMLSTGGTTNVLVNRNSVNYTTLASWQASNGAAFDQQSVDADPMFVNPGSGDFTPQNPQLNDIGANVGVATDILNAARNIASPDPGAFEFSLGNCTNPPVTGSVDVVPTVCPNSSFTLNLQGNSSGNGQTYQWQYSTDNINWVNIGTATTAVAVQTSQPSTRWYRAGVKCSSGNTLYTSSVQVTSPALVSGTFTISNAPTGGTNFQGFADAINYVKCGINGPVVFDVQTNVYSDAIVIPPIAGTSATNTVTFKGNGSTIMYNTSDANLRSAIILNGADYIVLDSFNVDVSGGTYGWGIVLTNQADSNVIRKCTINTNTTATTTNYVGIAINGSATSTATSGNNGNGNLITGNTINGGYYGIYLYGSTTPYIQNNVVRNNVVNDFYFYGIYFYGTNKTSISSNELVRPTRTPVTTTYGVYVSTNTNALVEKNRIHNLFDAATTSTSTVYCLYIGSSGLSTTEPHRIENNLIYNINNGAGSQYGIYGLAYNNLYYYHNTIVLDDAGSTAGSTYGMYVYGTGVNVKNNIVRVSRGGTGSKYTMYYSTTGVTTSNNNILLMESTGGTTNVLVYYNTAFNSLAAWQASNGGAYDQQSFDIDPMFANPGGGDFTPTSSFINNKGVPVGVLTDVNNAPRSTVTPDIGAVEFSTLTIGNNMGAELLITPGANSSGCYTANEPVTIRIRNNSTSAINFAVNPVTVTVNITGAVNQTLTRTLNTGSLQSDSTLDVLMSPTLNMTTAGDYIFNAYTTVANDANTANDAMVTVTRTKNVLSAGTASASPAEYCAPSAVMPVLSTTGSTGVGSLQWLQSTSPTSGFAAIPGATGTAYSVTNPLTQTMYYKLALACGVTRDTGAVVMVQYNNPQITGTTPGTRCGTGSVTLQATATGGAVVNWYTTATGGTPVYTGSSFNTPAISSNTTYYAAPSLGATTANVGPANLSIGSASVVGTYFLSFTVLNTATIKTVDAYFNAVGSPYTLIIRDASSLATVFTVSGTTSVSGTGTPQVLQLNATLPPGDYQMGWTTDPGTYRTSTGAAYPYTLPGVLSITGNTFNDPNYYYYFYNWQVSTGCEGARTAVLARTDDCTFPVTLLNFKGEKQGAINSLVWTTVTEVNNAGFELQRSADGGNFSTLAFAPSKSLNGSSNVQLTYAYDDVKPLAANNYYRLKQVDKDGKATYSQVVLIKGAKVNAVTISSIYPNPVHRELMMVISSPITEKVNLIVTDVTGKVVLQQTAQLASGDNQLKIPVQILSSGTYIIKAVCANGCESALQKFVKQ
jgi:parallel beta-helix repeat protein